jgi:hypothetical protein
LRSDGLFGITLRWGEGVPPLIAGQSFAHERRFASGPLRRVATEIKIRAAANGGSRVCYRLSIAPGGWVWGFFLRLSVLSASKDDATPNG